MRSILAPIKNPGETSQKKLSKQNLEAYQDQITSHPQPDIVLEWISRTSAMASSSKRKAISTLPSIAESGGQNLLYRIGISPIEGKATIPSDLEGTEEVRKYFPEPRDLPSLSSFMKSWFEKFQPNEASLVHFLCECLFPLKMSTPDEDNFAIILEFPGPFKSHNLHELERGDKGIKYPIVKHDPSQEVSQLLQTPAEEDLRSRSDFVFGASTCCLGEDIRSIIRLWKVPGVSNNGFTCAVAIVAEVKSSSSPASIAAAQNQWSSLAYLQIMERVSIRREASYVGDENICQYGYGICGLSIVLWKMGIKLNISERRESEILPTYYTFPVQKVGLFNIELPKHLERFVAIHQKLLHWWLNGYLRSYIKDITSIADVHPDDPELWRITWQQAVDKFSSDSRGKPEIELEEQPAMPPVRASSKGETQGVTTAGEQPARSPIGAANEGETQGATTAGEQPARSPVGAANEGETHGVCCGTTKSGIRCRKRVKNGKYCIVHRKEY